MDNRLISPPKDALLSTLPCTVDAETPSCLLHATQQVEQMHTHAAIRHSVKQGHLQGLSCSPMPNARSVAFASSAAIVLGQPHDING